jgi:hypothetical protein
MFGKTVLGLSGAFLVAGILLPGAAEILLRLYLLTLAGAFVAVRAGDVELPRRMTLDAYSPFTDERATRPPPEAPPNIRQRTSLLAAADDPVAARRTSIPVAVKWAILDEARHRLAERRGLDLNDPNDHPGIRSLVSAETWHLVRPPERVGAAAGPADTGLDRSVVPEPDAGSHPDSNRGPALPPVTLDRLPSILDDLERL